MCLTQRCSALSKHFEGLQRSILLLQRKTRRTDKQDTPHSADTTLQAVSLTGSPRLGSQTPTLPLVARGSTPATAVQMELQPSSEPPGVHASPHAIGDSSAHTSIPPPAPAPQMAQQVSADVSSEQASGNNAASMQTSNVPTQHAQVLPATAAPPNGHQAYDDMVGMKVAWFCSELISLLYTSLPKQLLTV